MRKRIYLAAPHLFGKEREYLKQAMDSNWIAPLGPFVNKLERMFDDYTGRHCVAVSSGTAGLHLAVIEAGVKDGDLVFCASNTFAASANPILYERGKPVFIDSDRDTYNMSFDELCKAARRYGMPKAVIVTHVYGNPADRRIFDWCKENHVTVIEDAAESLGSCYKDGAKTGTLGDMAVYSFNGNKIITGSSGGMVVCRTKAMALHVLDLATQSKDATDAYFHLELGHNYRMSNINAAILCAQFETLEKKLAMKRRIHDRYAAALNGIHGSYVLSAHDGDYSNYWLSVFMTGQYGMPSKILRTLRERNIEARMIWYPLALQPIYQPAHFSGVENAQYIFGTAICLPSDTNMTDEEQDAVIEIVKRVLA